MGEPFAWMEGVLIIARMAQSWNLSLVEDQKVEMLPRITLTTEERDTDESHPEKLGLSGPS